MQDSEKGWRSVGIGRDVTKGHPYDIKMEEWSRDKEYKPLSKTTGNPRTAFELTFLWVTGRQWREKANSSIYPGYTTNWTIYPFGPYIAFGARSAPNCVARLLQRLAFGHRYVINPIRNNHD